VNESKGVIAGTTALTLTLDTGANTIMNAGTIASTGTGLVDVKSAVANTGLLLVTAGTLETEGAVTGAGTARIVGKGVLDIAGAFAETVVFAAAATGTLELGDAKDFAGQVQNLSKTGANAIDIAGLAFVSGATTATYSGTTASGVLTVSNGTLSVSIDLIGNYKGRVFTVTDDGTGGVVVKDPPAASTATKLTGAMAAFQPPAPAAARSHTQASPGRYALVAAHR
jgi:hypothetical protein